MLQDMKKLKNLYNDGTNIIDYIKDQSNAAARKYLLHIFQAGKIFVCLNRITW